MVPPMAQLPVHRLLHHRHADRRIFAGDEELTRDIVVSKSKRLSSVLFLLVVVALVGCGNAAYDLAPVSGVVTLYGEPLVNATVSFEPQRNSGKSVVGPGSVGTTDDEGRYQLETFKQETGAVVGMHTVRISTYKSRFEDIKNSDKIEVVSIEHVPWHYNRNTELSFEVTADGTDEANFVLTAEPSIPVKK